MNPNPPLTVTPAARGPSLRAAALRLHGAMARIPESLVALVGRIAIAGVFWRSGQTKVEGFALDFVEGHVALGVPRLSESAVALFRDEYRLPLLAPELAAPMAAFAEHLFPLLLVLGLATRLSAAALLVMTAVIQVFVYPGAWPTHGVWAAVLLWLMTRGPGGVSLDHLLARRRGQ
jgi:putative oxidoreductase